MAFRVTCALRQDTQSQRICIAVQDFQQQLSSGCTTCATSEVTCHVNKSELREEISQTGRINPPEELGLDLDYSSLKSHSHSLIAIKSHEVKEQLETACHTKGVCKNSEAKSEIGKPLENIMDESTLEEKGSLEKTDNSARRVTFSDEVEVSSDNEITEDSSDDEETSTDEYGAEFLREGIARRDESPSPIPQWEIPTIIIESDGETSAPRDSGMVVPEIEISNGAINYNSVSHTEVIAPQEQFKQLGEEFKAKGRRQRRGSVERIELALEAGLDQFALVLQESSFADSVETVTSPTMSDHDDLSDLLLELETMHDTQSQTLPKERNIVGYKESAELHQCVANLLEFEHEDGASEIEPEECSYDVDVNFGMDVMSDTGGHSADDELEKDYDSTENVFTFPCKRAEEGQIEEGLEISDGNAKVKACDLNVEQLLQGNDRAEGGDVEQQSNKGEKQQIERIETDAKEFMECTENGIKDPSKGNIDRGKQGSALECEQLEDLRKGDLKRDATITQGAQEVGNNLFSVNHNMESKTTVLVLEEQTSGIHREESIPIDNTSEDVILTLGKQIIEVELPNEEESDELNALNSNRIMFVVDNKTQRTDNKSSLFQPAGHERDGTDTIKFEDQFSSSSAFDDRDFPQSAEGKPIISQGGDGVTLPEEDQGDKDFVRTEQLTLMKYEANKRADKSGVYDDKDFVAQGMDAEPRDSVELRDEIESRPVCNMEWRDSEHTEKEAEVSPRTENSYFESDEQKHQGQNSAIERQQEIREEQSDYEIEYEDSVVSEEEQRIQSESMRSSDEVEQETGPSAGVEYMESPHVTQTDLETFALEFVKQCLLQAEQCLMAKKIQIEADAEGNNISYEPSDNSKQIKEEIEITEKGWISVDNLSGLAEDQSRSDRVVSLVVACEEKGVAQKDECNVSKDVDGNEDTVVYIDEKTSTSDNDVGMVVSGQEEMATVDNEENIANDESLQLKKTETEVTHGTENACTPDNALDFASECEKSKLTENQEAEIQISLDDSDVETGSRPQSQDLSSLSSNGDTLTDMDEISDLSTSLTDVSVEELVMEDLHDTKNASTVTVDVELREVTDTGFRDTIVAESRDTKTDGVDVELRDNGDVGVCDVTGNGSRDKSTEELHGTKETSAVAGLCDLADTALRDVNDIVVRDTDMSDDADLCDTVGTGLGVTGVEEIPDINAASVDIGLCNTTDTGLRDVIDTGVSDPGLDELRDTNEASVHIGLHNTLDDGSRDMIYSEERDAELEELRDAKTSGTDSEFRDKSMEEECVTNSETADDTLAKEAQERSVTESEHDSSVTFAAQKQIGFEPNVTILENERSTLPDDDRLRDIDVTGTGDRVPTRDTISNDTGLRDFSSLECRESENEEKSGKTIDNEERTPSETSMIKEELDTQQDKEKSQECIDVLDLAIPTWGNVTAFVNEAFDDIEMEESKSEGGITADISLRNKEEQSEIRYTNTILEEEDEICSGDKVSGLTEQDLDFTLEGGMEENGKDMESEQRMENANGENMKMTDLEICLSANKGSEDEKLETIKTSETITPADVDGIVPPETDRAGLTFQEEDRSQTFTSEAVVQVSAPVITGQDKEFPAEVTPPMNDQEEFANKIQTPLSVTEHEEYLKEMPASGNDQEESPKEITPDQEEFSPEIPTSFASIEELPNEIPTSITDQEELPKDITDPDYQEGNCCQDKSTASDIESSTEVTSTKESQELIGIYLQSDNSDYYNMTTEIIPSDLPESKDSKKELTNQGQSAEFYQKYQELENADNIDRGSGDKSSEIALVPSIVPVCKEPGQESGYQVVDISEIPPGDAADVETRINDGAIFGIHFNATDIEAPVGGHESSVTNEVTLGSGNRDVSDVTVDQVTLKEEHPDATMPPDTTGVCISKDGTAEDNVTIALRDTPPDLEYRRTDSMDADDSELRDTQVFDGSKMLYEMHDVGARDVGLTRSNDAVLCDIGVRDEIIKSNDTRLRDMVPLTIETDTEQLYDTQVPFERKSPRASPNRLRRSSAEIKLRSPSATPAQPMVKNVVNAVTNTQESSAPMDNVFLEQGPIAVEYPPQIVCMTEAKEAEFQGAEHELRREVDDSTRIGERTDENLLSRNGDVDSTVEGDFKIDIIEGDIKSDGEDFSTDLLQQIEDTKQAIETAYESDAREVTRLLEQSDELMQKRTEESVGKNGTIQFKTTTSIKLQPTEEQDTERCPRAKKESKIRSFEMLVYLETIAKELENFRIEQKLLKDSFRTCIAEVIRSISSLNEAIEFFERRTVTSLQECRMKLGRRIDKLDEEVSSKVATTTLVKSYNFTQGQFTALKQRVKDLEELCISLKLRELKEEISREVMSEVSNLMARVDITSSDVGGLKQQVRELEEGCASIRRKLAGYGRPQNIPQDSHLLLPEPEQTNESRFTTEENDGASSKSDITGLPLIGYSEETKHTLAASVEEDFRAHPDEVKYVSYAVVGSNNNAQNDPRMEDNILESVTSKVKESSLTDIDETLSFLEEQSGLIEKQIEEAGRSRSASWSKCPGVDATATEMPGLDVELPVAYPSDKSDTMDFPPPPPSLLGALGNIRPAVVLGPGESEPPPPGYGLLATVSQQQQQQQYYLQQQQQSFFHQRQELLTHSSERFVGQVDYSGAVSHSVSLSTTQQELPQPKLVTEPIFVATSKPEESPSSLLRLAAQVHRAAPPKPPRHSKITSKNQSSIPSSPPQLLVSVETDGHPLPSQSPPVSPRSSSLRHMQNGGLRSKLLTQLAVSADAKDLLPAQAVQPQGREVYPEQGKVEDDRPRQKQEQHVIQSQEESIEQQERSTAFVEQSASSEDVNDLPRLPSSLPNSPLTSSPPTSPRSPTQPPKHCSLILTDPILRGVKQNQLIPGELFSKHCVDGGMNEMIKHVQRIPVKHVPQYRFVVIHCGTNDVLRVTGEEFQYMQLKLLAIVRSKWPQALVVMSGMILNRSDKAKNAKITRLNQITRNYCSRNQNCTYIDNTSAVLGEDGTIDGSLYFDENHLNNTNGTERVMENMRTALQNLLAESTDVAYGDGPESRTEEACPGDQTAGPTTVQSKTPSGTPTGLSMREYNALYDWLESCKLAIYVEHFVRAGFDMFSVAGLTPEDLTAINVTKTGHRKKLLSESGKLEAHAEIFPTQKPADIMSWLRLIGLDQYIPQFLDGGFDDMDFVQDITIEDLEAIGITRTGHQRKIWMAVKTLQDTNTADNNNRNATIGGNVSSDSGGRMPSPVTQDRGREGSASPAPLSPKGYMETDLDTIAPRPSSGTMVTTAVTSDVPMVTPSVTVAPPTVTSDVGMETELHDSKDHETDLDTLLSHLEAEGVIGHESAEPNRQAHSAEPHREVRQPPIGGEDGDKTHRDPIRLAENGILDENLLEVSVPSLNSSQETVKSSEGETEAAPKQPGVAMGSDRMPTPPETRRDHSDSVSSQPEVVLHEHTLQHRSVISSTRRSPVHSSVTIQTSKEAPMSRPTANENVTTAGRVDDERGDAGRAVAPAANGEETKTVVSEGKRTLESPQKFNPPGTSAPVRDQPSEGLEDKVRCLSLDSSPRAKRPPPPVKPKSIKRSPPKIAPKPAVSPTRSKANSFSGQTQTEQLVSKQERLSPKLPPKPAPPPPSPTGLPAPAGSPAGFSGSPRSKASSFSGQTGDGVSRQTVNGAERLEESEDATSPRRYSTGSKNKKVPPPTPPKTRSGSRRSSQGSSDGDSEKLPPPTPPKTRSGSRKSSQGSSDGDPVESAIDDTERRKQVYEERRRSFEKLQRKYSDPSNSVHPYTSPRRDVITSQRGYQSDGGEALDEQIKSVFRRPSIEDLLNTDELKPPPATEEPASTPEDIMTEEELQREIDSTDNLFKDINSMLSDFSTELDTMFDNEISST